jgi:spore germination cell wall hydrolase CwlJ-like protein
MTATTILLLALATTNGSVVQQTTTKKEVCPGATHFYSGTKKPAWANKMRLVCVIGGHKFYAPIKHPKKENNRGK